MIKTDLNANAGWLKNSSIVAIPEWAAQLILNNTKKMQDIFKITIGHELTHKESDLWPFRFGIKKTKFVAWVNEVHADFSATQKMVNSNREILLESIDYKLKMHPNSTDSFSHPSWQRRKEYAEKFDFD